MGKRRTQLDSAVLVEARRNKVPVREMAEQFGCSTTTINRALASAGEYIFVLDYDPTPADMERWCKAHVSDLRREHPDMEGVR